jgi:hypothetical protein
MRVDLPSCEDPAMAKIIRASSTYFDGGITTLEYRNLLIKGLSELEKGKWLWYIADALKEERYETD